MVRELAGVLLGLGLPMQIQAQGTFSMRYDPLDQNLGDFGWSLERDSSGGFFLISNGSWSDSIFYGSVIVVSKITDNGVLLATHRFVDPGFTNYPGWANSSFVIADGSYGIGGSRNPIGMSSASSATLFLFDGTGAPLQTYTYGVPGDFWAGRQGKQAMDSGYVIVGERTLNNNNDGFLIKTDASGAQEWVQTYGGPNNDYMIAVDTDQTGGYYLGGAYGLAVSNHNLWVKRVNEQGNQIWDRRWGTVYEEPNAHLTASSDGHVLVASAWQANEDAAYLYMAKLDSANGSTIWDRHYGIPTVNTTLFVVQEVAPGGDLIATGQAANTLGQYRGVLLRTASTGDSLWMRYYSYYDAHVDSSKGQLRDVLPTPDGGFIAVGAAFAAAIDTGGYYSQDVWVVKTDGYGCIEPGCQLIMGMQTQITNLRNTLTVAPNPVASGGSVQVRIAPPENFTPQGTLKLTVVSSDGRVVYEEKIAEAGISPSPSERAGVRVLSLAHLSPGLYHVHLSDATRWISGAKLVVE